MAFHDGTAAISPWSHSGRSEFTKLQSLQVYDANDDSWSGEVDSFMEGVVGARELSLHAWSIGAGVRFYLGDD